MLDAPIPENERQRLEALRALEILDTPREERFDRLVRLASSILNTPMAAVSLVDEARQWFKASVGLAVRETPRDISFCGHAIHGDGPFVVPDALTDTRFADNPLVVEEPHVRAYAGQPLSSPHGLRIGTLCVIDQRARDFTDDELRVLSDLGALVERELHLDELINLQKKARAAELLSRRLESKVSEFFSLSIDMLCIAGTDGFFQRINPAWSATLGWSEEELLAKPYLEFVHPHDREATVAEASKLGKGGRTVSFENRYLCRDGMYKTLRWNAVASGDDGSIYAIARDITESNRIDKLKNEFVSTVSHELRTPLTSIRGSLDLIGSGVTGELPEASLELVDIARNNCDRLVLLINDILDMEKIEAGKIEFRTEPHDIVRLIERAIRENESFAEQHGVRLALQEAVSEAWASVDPDRLLQVLTNLLSNAAKFAPPGSAVEVAVTRGENTLRVSVRDHGDGIPVAFREHIFGKFAQADASDSRARGGTGLGLNISKAIIERLGGTIAFQTELGRGTTFFFELPAIAPLAVSTGPSVKAPPARVLICEDDHDIARILRMTLQSAGHACDVAHTAAEAVARLRSGSYAAMTLDLVLPDEDGISLMRRLRSDPATRSLPIVVVSARAGEGRDELHGAAVGVIDWLEKPIDQERLLAGIRTAVTARLGARSRILHVEDDPDVQHIVRLLLSGVADVTVVSTIAEARVALSRETFDLALLDCRLPDGRGTELLPLLSGAEGGPTPVVIFSAFDVTAAEARDVAAVLLKSRASGDALRATIRSLIGSAEPATVS